MGSNEGGRLGGADSSPRDRRRFLAAVSGVIGGLALVFAAGSRGAAGQQEGTMITTSEVVADRVTARENLKAPKLEIVADNPVIVMTKSDGTSFTLSASELGNLQVGQIGPGSIRNEHIADDANIDKFKISPQGQWRMSDIPPLTPDKYPGGFLLDGSRAMQGSIIPDIDAQSEDVGYDIGGYRQRFRLGIYRGIVTTGERYRGGSVYP